MLSSKDLSKILGVELKQYEINDIHWKTQNSTKDSILFYKLNANESTSSLFKTRIETSFFSLLIVNKDHEGLPQNSIVISEDRWPEIQKQILDILYPLPALKILAVTGTNGKTTTTDLALQLGTLAGKKGLSIGTLGVREYQHEILDFGQTTPSFIDLRKYLFLYGADKDFCVIEASSHALVQNRFYKLNIVSAGWPSFSQDHLDYHQSMDEYFKAKCLVFDLINPDGSLFVPHEQVDLFMRLINVNKKTKKTSPINQTLPLFLRTSFNKNNLEVASSMVESSLGIEVHSHIEKLVSPEGRFYIQIYRSNYIVVDFAHTPDALVNICQGIRESFPNHKLKVLFGCGGDRDRTKRPLMGRAAETFSEKLYITSDNPRSENPDSIIDDIVKGLAGKDYIRTTSRPEAVKIAFTELGENEVLLLAGKGHEDYILINDIKYPYSDIEEVEKFVKGQL